MSAVVVPGFRAGDGVRIARPLSVPFWEQRMGYDRRAIVFRKRP